MRQSLSVAALFGLGLTGVAIGAAPAPVSRTVYVTAVDAKGALVSDLTAADVAVKEGGKAREIVKVEPATGMMQVMILVDDNGSGLFRAGVASLIQQMQGRAEFAISSVVGQMLRIMDFTTTPELLVAGVGKLGPRPGTPDGGQLLEGVYESARAFAERKADHPVIVALTVGGEEHSTREAEQVLTQLARSGAILHVITVGGSNARQMAQGANAHDQLTNQMEGNMARGKVLGDGPRQSGGRQVEVVATGAVVQAVQQLANELMHLYAVTYTLPEGTKLDARLSLTATRKGVALRAPTRISDK